MKQEQRFEKFKNNYFNKYTYVGITGDGNFKKQSHRNFRILIMSSLLILSFYIPWGRLFELDRCADVLVRLSCLLGAVILLLRHTGSLQERYKKNILDNGKTVDPYDLNVELKRYYQENIGMIDPSVLSRLLDDCKKKMDLWKQGSTIVINSLVVILSVIISVFLSPILTVLLGGHISKGQLTLEDNLWYCLFSVVVLGFLTWIQYLFTKNSLGPLHAYNQMYYSLEELREFLIKEEEEAKKNKLIEDLFLKLENEKRSNSGFIEKIIKRFFN